MANISAVSVTEETSQRILGRSESHGQHRLRLEGILRYFVSCPIGSTTVDPERGDRPDLASETSNNWLRRSPRLSSLAAGVLTLIAVVAACGSTQTTSTTNTSTKAEASFSGRVEIGGGRKMYIECRGSESPTVVLISGLPIAGDLWDSPLGKSPTVFPTVAKTTRVCTYDRPGTRWRRRAAARAAVTRCPSRPRQGTR